MACPSLMRELPRHLFTEGILRLTGRAICAAGLPAADTGTAASSGSARVERDTALPATRPVTTPDERKALNETTFRRANDTIEKRAAALLGEDEPSPVPFLCECPRRDCTQVVLVTFREYEGVRADPRHGLAASGHEDPEIERIVERNDRFLVTEKLGRAGEVVVEQDPRS